MDRIYDDLKKLKYEANQIALSGNIEKAIRILEGICFIDPNSFDSHFNLGELYYKQNNIKKSKEHFTKALEIKPNDKNTIIHLELLNEDNEKKNKFNEKKNTHLKILFLQNSPCIRNYKYAVALRKHGVIIDLAYTGKSLAERYPGLSNDVYNNIFKINSYPQLWDLAQNYDLIHSHNEPDTLTVAALASHKPLIHDTHDLISLRNQNKPDLEYFEGIANRAPEGRIYSTEIQRELAFKMYNFEELSEVFYNYISEDDKPKLFHKKLSDIDGKVHIIYEGGIGGVAHRNFHNIFIELAHLGFEIHIYPALYLHKTAEIFSSYKNIYYYQPVSPTILMEEMTKYDFGIIPWNVTTVFLDIIPRLKSGVIVQIHDIQLPFDYPLQWDKRYYNEQYLLASYLLAEGNKFEILLPNAFITWELAPGLNEIVKPFFEGKEGISQGGGSFWLKIN